MAFEFKKQPRAGVCPVKFCRRKSGCKKRLCDRHHHQQWRMKNPVRAAWLNLRHHAAQRRKEFTLTFDEFVAFTSLNSYLDDKGNTRLALHLDRKDNSLGYTASNIQVLTCSENVIKENDRKKYVKYFQELEAASNCPF